MADYIDKQKTLNVIFDIAENVIKSLPSADVIEVVRCYECVWWDNCPSSTITPTFRRCKRVGQMGTEANDYCSYGERKYGRLH